MLNPLLVWLCQNSGPTRSVRRQGIRNDQFPEVKSCHALTGAAVQQALHWMIIVLEGQDLRSYMENLKLTRQPYEIDDALETVSKICEALAYAHEFTHLEKHA